MTAQTNQPAKFLVPFAQNDTSRVEIPVTTSDATRASQSAGFPPLTMQPPESGGVPPQGEDFNGAMNQVARIAWWLMLGGRFAFDNAFATASQISGYPKGAVLQGLDAAGDWINTTDNNTTNPDTSTDPAGGGYVPGYQYGVTALTGLTGGTVTLTNAQAAKSTLTLVGTLTSALIVVVPTWRKRWSVTNNTTGAFAVTVKTAAGTGIAIPQNGGPTEVTGDGTNITFPAQNIPAATDANQPVRLGQFVNTVGGSARAVTLPDGTIMQFGTATLPNSGARTSTVTVTLPLTWPTGYLSATASANGGANSTNGGLPAIGPTANTATTITFTADTLAYTTFNQPVTFNWIAFGR